MKQVHAKNKNEWPADHVERRSVDRLIPYARNARTHSEEQVAQLAASIKEWGWTTPVLVDEEGSIIAGHGRVMAARKLGIEEIPVMVARGWTEAQRRAYVLADNQLAANAGWDMDLLKVEIGELGAEGFNLDLIGFDDKMLTGLMAEETDGLTDADAVPEVPAEPVTVLGDVWMLGRHRIICGSSTEADTVSKLLGDVKPHLMVTDPPYGVEYDAGWRNDGAVYRVAPGKSRNQIVLNDDNSDWREAWILFPGDVAYIWHAGSKAHIVADSLISSGFEVRSQIIWAKQHFAISRGHYHIQHEPCWYVVRAKGGTGHWAGDRSQTSLWHIEAPNGFKKGKGADAPVAHSTQKPVECMKRPIENNSSPGQAVYEPFSGSGTTIIAGEMTGRHVYAIELNPAYVDVAVKRWQEFTGKEAIHAETGKTFNEMSNARSA